MTSLHELSLSQLKDGLSKKQFSSVELTTHLLSRIDSAQGLNAFVQVLSEHALQSAKDADEALRNGKQGALLGIPIALKDNILARGSRTTCASKFLENFESPYDATVTKKLRERGAVIIAKANMDEFAMGSSNETSAFGPTRNPWNTSKVPGGTSGGSAVSVAAELTPVSIGTDTGGSVRQPASFCGVYGIKPTYGRVSRYGVVAYASSLDQVGCLARSAEDLATTTSVICGHDPHDSTSVDKALPDLSAALTRGVKGLRVGVPREYFIAGMDPAVEANVRKAIGVLEGLGASIVEVSLPHTEASLNVYYVIAPAEASSNLARFDGIRYGRRAENTTDLKDLYFKSRSQGFGKEVKRRILVGSFVLSTGYYDAYYLRAQKVRTLVAKDFHNVFENSCDVIACPVAPTTAFGIGEKFDNPLAMYLGDVFTIPVNLAGLPGMSIPCGFDAQGLPIGLQVIGKPWAEESLFQVAGAYEQATDWAKQRPPAPLLSSQKRHPAGHNSPGSI